jgi:hypothetical protein
MSKMVSLLAEADVNNYGTVGSELAGSGTAHLSPWAVTPQKRGHLK